MIWSHMRISDEAAPGGLVTSNFPSSHALFYHQLLSKIVLPSPIISITRQSAPDQGLIQSAYTLLRCNRRADIANIPHEDVDSFFVIHCEIVKLETRHGWMYEGCSKCGSKLRSENSKVVCMTCKRAPHAVEPKFKVHYTVKDETGRTSVVFFDKVTVQLIGRTALELKVKLEKEDRSYDFPDELDNVVGKKLLIKLKVNKYNVDYPNSSITVSAFSECSNLIDEFEDVAEGSNSQPDTVMQDADCVIYDNPRASEEVSSGPTPTLLDSIVIDSIGLEQIPTQNASLKSSSKGKRKQSWKKVHISAAIHGTDITASPSKAPPKPSKTIKQEKIMEENVRNLGTPSLTMAHFEVDKENRSCTQGTDVFSKRRRRNLPKNRSQIVLQDVSNVAVNLQTRFNDVSSGCGVPFTHVVHRNSYRLSRMQNQGASDFDHFGHLSFELNDPMRSNFSNQVQGFNSASTNDLNMEHETIGGVDRNSLFSRCRSTSFKVQATPINNEADTPNASSHRTGFSNGSIIPDGLDANFDNVELRIPPSYSGKEELYKYINFSYSAKSLSDSESSVEDNEHDDGLDAQINIERDTGPATNSANRMCKLGYIHEGAPSYTCIFCHACLWFKEKVGKSSFLGQPLFSICCLQGKVQLPKLSSPPESLYSMYFDKNSPSFKNFRENIRSYNNMFSFTSMGGKVDHSKNCGAGPYTFVLSGMNYHRIGSLLPPDGQQPVYSQLYIYDTENEVSNRISAVSKHLRGSTIDPTIVDQIKKTLDEFNPFVKHYRMAADFIQHSQCRELKLRLIGARNSDGRNYNLPSISEVAALIVGDIDINFAQRDILVEELSGQTQRIDELHASYLPLQYPLLFPRGEDGYRDDIEHREETLSTTKKKKRVSMREFFAYRLMFRDDEVSTILHSERLLQQFIVDAYTMLESQRVLWVRTHQKELRVDLYQGLSDALLSGERSAQSTGKRIILPSSFTGGARYMLQNYQNAMALCGTFGYPEFFITFTCNPAWPEVKDYCNANDVSTSNRAEILARVFHLKLKRFMRIIKDKKIFGAVQADVYTIEFQKRGLPHAHILLWLNPTHKLKEPDDIDRVISAEIPDKHTSPKLYELVKKFMIHGPCGALNRKAQCMKDQSCSKYFPKQFSEHTTIDDDGYPTYRRRDDGRTIEVKGIPLDNRFVVPYNSSLLYMFQAHINVEKCNQSTAIKYLFKYISKGHDRVVASIYDNAEGRDSHQIVDEIQKYYNFRYISPCEAAWRIFGFDIHRRNPGVERLCFHLPNQQSIIYLNTDDVSDLLDKVRVAESMFLSWMKTNESDSDARKLLYSEFPKEYVYERSSRSWKKRKRGRVIGRITYVSPSAGELYYLRILLTKVRGPRSFEEIRMVDGVIHPTFREACFARGLVDDDREYVQAIKEAAVWASGASLRRMFVSMLLCSSLNRPDFVWGETSVLLSEDLLYVPRNEVLRSGVQVSQFDKEQVALLDIQSLLEKKGRTLHDFPMLPLPSTNQIYDVSNQLILQELSYDRVALKEQSEKMIQELTDEQKEIFYTVLSALNSPYDNFFFVYGYGGTGKTFLWNALASTIRAKGEIVITVSSSGIAATLLPSGRTAHSRFAIPIQITEDSVCSISQGSPLENLLTATKLIIWDEAPMVQRYCIEALDRTMKDILHCARPFGGKCVVMGGDFRQILPVIPKASRATVVDACISSSYLWNHCKVFSLTRNMRLSSHSPDQEQESLRDFAIWLLDVGDGKLGLPHDGEAEIKIPRQLLLDALGDPIGAIVDSTYPNLLGNIMNNEYFNDRAILAPTIEAVNRVNDFICEKLLGESVEYLSCDSVCKSCQDNDCFDEIHTTEFLNTINCSGLPSHKVTLKVGCPIMLLRNIDQANGLCNGTRLIVTQLGHTVIEAVTLNGSHPNQKVLIHRMDMNPSNSSMPFRMKRRQFPISLSFAMTINKSQGQSLRHVGLFLSKPVFTHGQLYVALSRVRSMEGLKIVLGDETQARLGRTKNVVYREVFRNLSGVDN